MLPAPRTILGCAVLTVIGGAVAVLLFILGEVTDSGDLLDGLPPVDRVELPGGLDVYVDQRTTLKGNLDLATPDAVTALGFAAVGNLTLLAAAMREVTAGTDRVWRFYFIAAHGSFFLCIDEIYTLHETFGYNTDIVTALPVITHADDFFVLCFGLAGLVFVIWYRDLLRRHPVPAVILLIGGAIFGGAAVLDLLIASFEEQVEGLGAAVVAVAYFLYVLEDYHSSAVGASLRRSSASHDA